MKWFLIDKRAVDGIRSAASVLSLFPNKVRAEQLAEIITRHLDHGVREFHGTHPDNLIDDGK